MSTEKQIPIGPGVLCYVSHTINEPTLRGRVVVIDRPHAGEQEYAGRYLVALSNRPTWWVRAANGGTLPWSTVGGQTFQMPERLVAQHRLIPISGPGLDTETETTAKEKAHA